MAAYLAEMDGPEAGLSKAELRAMASAAIADFDGAVKRLPTQLPHSSGRLHPGAATPWRITCENCQREAQVITTRKLIGRMAFRCSGCGHRNKFSAARYRPVK